MLTIALFLVSCGSTKTATLEQTTATALSSSQQTQRDSLLFARMDAELERVMQQASSFDMQAVIFDTTQPADSATGLPPVKAAIRQRRQVRTTDCTRERQKTAQAAEVSTATKAAEHSKTASTLQVKKRQKLATDSYLVCGLLSVLLGAAATVTIYIKRKRNEYRSNH